VKVLVALPALNEEAAIGAVLRSIPDTLSGSAEVLRLVIDDGSTDRTAKIAATEGARVIKHDRPSGVGRAFHTAVEQALETGADILVTIDADGQFDPRQIPELIAPIARGEADFVTGSRFRAGARPQGIPAVKHWGNRLITSLLRFLTKRDLSDVSCGFRAYSREALYHLNLFGRFTYTQETVLDLTFKGLRVTEVPIAVRYFEERQSRVAGSLFRYGYNALTIIARTARDLKPMRFFGVSGLAVFLTGAILDAWLMLFFLRTGGFSPYKFVGFTGVSLNVAGILIFGLALLADMLNRTRLIQERTLYYQRRALFGSGSTAGTHGAPASETLRDAEERERT
jgi:glycosyltransferase involved in cell wall biosynthesis